MITARNRWTDDPVYGPQQTIPNDLERSCGHNGCQGRMRLVEGTDFWDADGRAMVDTTCDICGVQSYASWWWPTGRCPAEDPNYGE